MEGLQRKQNDTVATITSCGFTITSLHWRHESTPNKSNYKCVPLSPKELKKSFKKCCNAKLKNHKS